MFARNFGRGEYWLHGVVKEVKGDTDYLVLLEDGGMVHRHIDQIKFRHATTDIELEDFGQSSTGPEIPSSDQLASIQQEDSAEAGAASVAAGPAEAVLSESETIPQTSPEVDTSAPEPVQLRRSGRERTTNVRLKDYVW